MAKYLFITGKNGSEWIDEYETLNAAIAAADHEWRHTNDADKSALEYAYILESVNPDPDAENHLDGDIVKVYKESL